MSDNAIYFVPYLLPGDAKPALQWSPTGGLTTSGNLTYMPEPGTDWKDVDPSKYDNIIDAFHNEAVYKEAEKLLGKDMPDMATSLLVGGGTEKTASGAFYASGCVPHDCGGNDGFMAVDPAQHKLYFARRGDNGRAERLAGGDDMAGRCEGGAGQGAGLGELGVRVALASRFRHQRCVTTTVFVILERTQERSSVAETRGSMPRPSAEERSGAEFCTVATP